MATSTMSKAESIIIGTIVQTILLKYKYQIKRTAKVIYISSTVKRFSKRWGIPVAFYSSFVLIAFLLMLPQLESKAWLLGADSIFHMNQFYETAMQIKTGHLSWFLALFGFSRNARIVDAMYGPIFSYLMGKLLLICGTWLRFEFIFSLGVLSLAGMSAGWLFHLCHVNRLICIPLSVMYMCSVPVFGIVTDQSFDGLGLAFVPFAVGIGIKMWQKHDVPVIPLAVMTAIVGQIHILTVVIFALILIPFAVLSVISSYHKWVWLLHACEAVGLVIALTADVWGTLLDVMSSTHTVPPFSNRFMTSPEFAVQWVYHEFVIVNTVSVGVFVATLFLGALTIYLTKRWDKLLCISVVMSAWFFWISSVYFPWMYLSKKLPMLRQTIQFPRRFAGLFIIFGLLSLGRELYLLSKLPLKINQTKFGTLTQIGFIIGMTIMALCTIQTVETAHQAIQSADSAWWGSKMVTADVQHPAVPLSIIRKSAYNHDLGKAVSYFRKPIPDYLPSNQMINYSNFYKIHPYGLDFRHLMYLKLEPHKVLHPKHKTNKPKYWDAVAPKEDPLNLHKHIVGRNTLEVDWTQPESMSGEKTRIPVVKYGHTNITLNGHEIKHVHICPVGEILLHPKAGQYHMTLNYQPSVWWYMAMWIAVISWIGALAIITVGLI